MKKTFKRAGVAVLSMAMLLSMGAIGATTASAAGEGKIQVVSADTGLSTSDSVTIYKVAELNASNQWQWINGFGSITGIETNFATIGGYENNSSQAKTLASLLARNASTVNTGTTYTGNVGEEITLDTTKGYYLVVVTTSQAGEIVQPMLKEVAANTTEQIRTLKKDTIGVEKTITSVTDNKGTVPGDGNLATAGDQSVINYLIATSIPSYDAAVTASSATLLPFTITDTPDAALSVNTSTINVFIDTNANGVADAGETVLTKDTGDTGSGGDYTVTGSFTVTLTKAATITYGGQNIAVTFSATLDTSSAPNATHEYDNTATISYGNDYSTGGGEKTQSDDADVYSIPLEITKTNSETDAAMADVTFTLTDTVNTGNVYTATTNASGKATFDGIYAGTFTLHENTPEGFQVNADQTVTVTFNATTQKWTVTNATYNNETPDTKATKAITNTPVDTLPGTGGMGTVLFTVGGAAVVLLAGFLFVVYMRRRKVEE